MASDKSARIQQVNINPAFESDWSLGADQGPDCNVTSGESPPPRVVSGTGERLRQLRCYSKQAFEGDTRISLSQDTAPNMGISDVKTAANGPGDAIVTPPATTPEGMNRDPEIGVRSRDISHDFPSGGREMNGHAHAVKEVDTSDYSSEEDDFEETRCTRFTDRTHGVVCRTIGKHESNLWIALWVFLLFLYTAFFTWAIVYDVIGAIPLIVITFIVLFVVLVNVIIKCFGDRINNSCCVPLSLRLIKYWKYIAGTFYALVIIGLVLFVAMDMRTDPTRLTSFTGLIFMILIGYVGSKYPSRIRWRPVIWGLVMQWILGLLVLRWTVGLKSIKWFADQVVKFLSYADEGSKFVFGETAYTQHPFAFQSLPVVIFFSAIIGILYYIGFMQAVVKVMAWLMQVTMGTTAIESLASASNIFVSYVEVAPILIPYVKKLTKSELHAILTSGFATVAGSILALYISFGAPAEHLVSACILSAPAALAMAKLSYPETKKSRTRTMEDVELPKGKELNFIEAAANGAMIAIKLVAGIAACLIAFLGIVGFVNAVLSWMGQLIGFPDLTFKFLCSYLLWPLAVMMGVEPKDAFQVAGMLGWKIFVDEVLCYRDLGEAVRLGQLETRSAVIATYACCGFGSLGALGVALGAMMAITPPSRRGVVTQVVIRALINGNMAAFMTACIAGVLYQGGHTYDLSAFEQTNSSLASDGHATSAVVLV